MKTYKRKAYFKELKTPINKEHSYIEVTEWNNLEGFDVNIYNYTDRTMSFTYHEFEVLRKMIKKIEKNETN